MRSSTLTLLVVCGLLAPCAAAAQARQQLTFEASVFRGTVGYARQVAPALHVGAEVGFGFPQLDRTLSPSEPRFTGEADFREYLHAALFARHHPVRLLSYDVGLRASIVDLWPCTASDCWPGYFLGGYVQPMLGGRVLSVGPRLVAGWATEPQDGGQSSFTVSVAPLNLRLTVPW